jgi:hypothetical protein
VAEAEQRQARNILRPDLVAFGDELVKGGVRVDRVPQHDEIDDQAERSQLVFRTFTIALAQFTGLSMEDDAGELMASFTAIELDENTAPVAFIVDEPQKIEGLDEAAEFLQGASETGWPVIGLKRQGEASGLYNTEFEGRLRGGANFYAKPRTRFP